MSAECIFLLPVYQSCEDYFNEGITTSADYLVDPDWNGPIEGFNVYCDVDSSKADT